MTTLGVRKEYGDLQLHQEQWRWQVLTKRAKINRTYISTTKVC